ncbi:MAG: hypothetical protein R8L58_03500 [Mariprofundaceae bacterium]
MYKADRWVARLFALSLCLTSATAVAADDVRSEALGEADISSGINDISDNDAIAFLADWMDEQGEWVDPESLAGDGAMSKEDEYDD